MTPYQGGGDMIDEVKLEGSTYAALPHRFEAGTPHIAGAVGLGAAVDFIESVGREAIERHERELVRHALDRLSEVPGIRIFGPADPAERAGVVSFTLEGIHPHDLATILDGEGVAIRAGHHCTQPLMRRLGVSATARASFSAYNSFEDVDQLLRGLDVARALFAAGADR